MQNLKEFSTKSLDKAVNALDRIEFILHRMKHLPGRHSQASHGRGGGGSGEISFSGKPANPKGLDTEQRFKHKDGSWTKERKQLHKQIIDKVIKDSGATPVKNPVSYMMGGGTASGKSVTIKSGQVKMPKNIVEIDSDAMKSMLPEYQEMTKKGDPKAAAFAHEESSYLSKQVLKAAVKGNYNTMLDGTGDSGLDSLEKKIRSMKKGGRKVVANYVSVDTETAIERNIARAKKTGRLVPNAFIRRSHEQVSRVVPTAIKLGLYDDFTLYDTNTQGKAIKVATAKGKNLKVHDQKLWERFLAKGKGE